MNRITKLILEHCLKYTDFWDKKTGRILHDKVIDELIIGREAIWLDVMYFPIMKKMALTYKNNNVPLRWRDFDGEVHVHYIGEWYEETVNCNQEELSYWRPVDELDADFFDQRLNELFQCIWNNHPDWIYEEPTEQEMLALGVHPGNIAAQQPLMVTPESKPKRHESTPPTPKKPTVDIDKPTQTSMF